MKTEKQKLARGLRERGYSVREIAARLSVSRSSVSRWVREVPLSAEQQQTLNLRNPAITGHCAGAQTNKKQGEERRKSWRQEGRKQAKAKDPLHMAGCMLYWGEGDKSRNTMGISNSDPQLLRLFLTFLKTCMGVDESAITMRLHVHTDLVSVEESEAFWLRSLGLSHNNLRKAIVNHTSKASKARRSGSLKYGTCRLVVNHTPIVQRIYGALQEYANFQGNNKIF